MWRPPRGSPGEVPARDGVDRVRGHLVEAERGSHLPAVGVEVDARQGARAERQPPALALGEAEARTVAGEHPEVGQEMVSEVHRLRTLKMRVAGHRPVDVLLGPAEQHPHQRLHGALGARRALTRVHREVCDDLVVARAGGVQPPADGPDDLCQAPLDRHVDVLVVRPEGKAPLAELPGHLVKAPQDRVAILGADDLAIGEHARVRP